MEIEIKQPEKETDDIIDIFADIIIDSFLKMREKKQEICDKIRVSSN